MDKDNEGFSLDQLLNELYKPQPNSDKVTLNSLFEKRLNELDITRTDAQRIINIEYRTLNGILSGSQKRVDFFILLKLAGFLKISKHEIATLYLEAMEQSFPDAGILVSDKIEFIKSTFDLATLRKVGFIKSITDFEEIEHNICELFELSDIFEYKSPSVDVAFSSGAVQPNNLQNRAIWLMQAEKTLKALNNTYEYNRDSLIKYFSKIRWHSTDVNYGLVNVIKDLYKLGITVVWQASLPTIHLRGATIPVNGKPCIILTNYRGFYPTIWFALLHELYHVIFDWEEIKVGKYHFSEEEGERQLSVREKEQEADNFAREYLFSNDKLSHIQAYIDDDNYVDSFARSNHVHKSFIYVFHAFNVSKSQDKFAWARAKKYNPDITGLLNHLENSWEGYKPISQFIKPLKLKIYN
jgi:HTH-type transcriptional regulator/antitoxin HigA